MGLVPVVAHPDVHVERHGQLSHPHHLVDHQLAHGVDLGLRDLQQQLVVDLQQQPCLQRGPLQGVVVYVLEKKCVLFFMSTMDSVE